MSMVFRRIETDGIAQISYFIGDTTSSTAAVIDPRPNVAVYLDLGRQHGLAITHIFETHIHADYMSGARELANRLPSARWCVSGEADAGYAFQANGIHEGNIFELGDVRITVRHTPGHTPEHVSFEVSERGADRPWAIFTGDSLFVGSAGRPDLLGSEQTDALIKQLFDTLNNYYGTLEDGIMILPCHGSGSACGADIGDRPMSTIGYERAHNPFLKIRDFHKFKQFVVDGAPPEPNHYQHLKKQNAVGPAILGRMPDAQPLTADQFRSAIEADQSQLVDTRQMLAFGGGHIPGAINIGLRPELSVWAGQMLDYDRPILLVVEDETNLEWVIWHFVYTGFTNFNGYLTGGMKAWEIAGFPLQRLPQMSVHELHGRLGDIQLLDVRSPQEWESGRIPSAKHHYVAEMRKGVDGRLQLAKDQPVVVYCDSGYRAAIAASHLQRHGYTDVRNVPGSWQAWTRAGFEVEK